MGKREKTEYTEDYSISLKAVDEHDKTVEHLLDGYARVIQVGYCNSRVTIVLGLL